MNSRSFFILSLFLTIGLSSCGLFTKSKQSSKKYTSSKFNNLWMEKKSYHQDDTIRLNLSTTHPDELGLVDPDGNFFYLVYGPQVETITNGKPIMTVAQFRPITFIEIVPSTFKANPHNVRYSGNIKPFTQSGEYTFMISQNLSTDAMGAAETLKFLYMHEKKGP